MIRWRQAIVSFFGLVWIALLVILVADPAIYDRTLNLPPRERWIGQAVLLAAVTVLIAVLSIGVVRRWRWLFWLILIAFLAGILRLPAAGLEISGTIPTHDPTWYILLQGALGIVQFLIGILLLDGYRHAGPWGVP
jgi:hypothetical protein